MFKTTSTSNKHSNNTMARAKKTYELLDMAVRKGKHILSASDRMFSGRGPAVAAKHAAKSLCGPDESKHIYLRERDGNRQEQRVFHYIGSVKKVQTAHDAPPFVARPYHMEAKAKRVGKMIKRSLAAGEDLEITAGEAAAPAVAGGARSVRRSARRSGHRRSGHRRSGHRRSGHRRSGHSRRR